MRRGRNRLASTGINVSESPAFGDRFRNLKAELWWDAREWFEARGCKMSDDPRLVDLLRAREYLLTSGLMAKVLAATPARHAASTASGGGIRAEPYITSVEPTHAAALRYVARLAGVVHSDFYPFPKIARPGASHAEYDAVAYLLLQFLNASLRDDPGAREYLARSGPVTGMPADFLRVRELPAAPPMPTEPEFLEWLRYGRMAEARTAWRSHGAALVSRSRMFTTVLFLARGSEGPQRPLALA